MSEVKIDSERRGGTSASSAASDLLCAGRHLAQRNLPEVAGEYADEGRIIHAALADSGDGRLTKLTLEQRETFDRCREIEKKLVSQLFPDIPGHYATGEKFSLQKQLLHLPGGGPAPTDTAPTVA
jgi:hypothetical protein